MGEASEGLLTLRPVTFKYKQEPVEGTQPLQFGLIAVEVAELFHDDLPVSQLIVYDSVGHVPMEEIPTRSARDARSFLVGG